MTAPAAPSLCNARLAALARAPAGAADIPADAADATADNPLCGDEIRLRLVWDGDTLARLEHRTRGCAVCKASASLAATVCAGHPRDALLPLADAFERCLSSGDFTPLGGDFRILDGIAAYPSRLHCARLPWTALRRALASSRPA